MLEQRTGIATVEYQCSTLLVNEISEKTIKIVYALKDVVSLTEKAGKATKTAPNNAVSKTNDSEAVQRMTAREVPKEVCSLEGTPMGFTVNRKAVLPA